MRKEIKSRNNNKKNNKTIEIIIIKVKVNKEHNNREIRIALRKQ